MKTAREFAEQMAKEGIMSSANIDQAEQFFLRHGILEQVPYFMVTEAGEGSVIMKNQTTACVIELIVEPTESEEVKSSTWFNYTQFADLIKICQRLCLK